MSWLWPTAQVSGQTVTLSHDGAASFSALVLRGREGPRNVSIRGRIFAPTLRTLGKLDVSGGVARGGWGGGGSAAMQSAWMHSQRVATP